MNVTTLVEQVARVPDVIAVTLGGSRARGMARPDSDRDIGLYEKSLISRAGLEEAAEILAEVGWTPQRFQDSVAKTRQRLRLERPLDLVLDRAVRSAETP